MRTITCRNRQDVVDAIDAVLDDISWHTLIKCGNFTLNLDYDKVPEAVPLDPEKSRNHYSAKERLAAETKDVRFRQTVARWRRLVAKSPQYIWRVK